MGIIIIEYSLSIAVETVWYVSFGIRAKPRILVCKHMY